MLFHFFAVFVVDHLLRWLVKLNVMIFCQLRCNICVLCLMMRSRHLHFHKLQRKCLMKMTRFYWTCLLVCDEISTKGVVFYTLIIIFRKLRRGVRTSSI